MIFSKNRFPLFGIMLYASPREAPMSGALLHVGFDVLAWSAAALSFICTRRAGLRFPPSRSHDFSYLAALMFGAGIGAVLFGTANLWFSQQQGFARSIEGAVAGGILAVELYKR